MGKLEPREKLNRWSTTQKKAFWILALGTWERKFYSNADAMKMGTTRGFREKGTIGTDKSMSSATTACESLQHSIFCVPWTECLVVLAQGPQDPGIRATMNWFHLRTTRITFPKWPCERQPQEMSRLREPCGQIKKQFSDFYKLSDPGLNPSNRDKVQCELLWI